MSEYRQDAASGDWVIVAPERGARPGAPRRAAARARLPAHDRSCPFCPGNEHLLSSIVAETASTQPPACGTRVDENKSPDERQAPGESASDAAASTARGHHEVIIETPRHDADLSALPGEDLAALMRACRDRYAALAALPETRSVAVFRNQGAAAGASIAHPHSQVIACDMVPPRQAAVAARAREHHARHGGCLICDQLALELDDGRRIVEATDDFVVLVPYAARSPMEQLIVPRRHQPTFAAADARELHALGSLLQRALRRLHALLDDPPYNHVVESAGDTQADAPCMHWSLRIVPDLATPGGFELGTGLSINPSRPEDDAESLRSRHP